MRSFILRLARIKHCQSVSCYPYSEQSFGKTLDRSSRSSLVGRRDDGASGVPEWWSQRVAFLGSVLRRLPYFGWKSWTCVAFWVLARCRSTYHFSFIRITCLTRAVTCQACLRCSTSVQVEVVRRTAYHRGSIQNDTNGFTTSKAHIRLMREGYVFSHVRISVHMDSSIGIRSTSTSISNNRRLYEAPSQLWLVNRSNV